MRRLTGVAVIALGLTLTACVAPTPFQPAAPDGRDGYTVTPIETNRYRISFAGNSQTPRQMVDNNLLYLAAQVTLKNGFDWFEISMDSDDKTTSYPTFLTGPYDGWGGGWGGGWRGGWGGWGGPGYETDFSMPQNRYDHVAEILTRHGAKPPTALKGYDARDVMAHLQPYIMRTPDARPGPF